VLEIAVESEDISCVEFVGHLDEAGVGKAGGEISVFLKKSTNLPRRTGQLESDLQCSVFDGRQKSGRSSVRGAKHITTL